MKALEKPLFFHNEENCPIPMDSVDSIHKIAVQRTMIDYDPGAGGGIYTAVWNFENLIPIYQI